MNNKYLIIKHIFDFSLSLLMIIIPLPLYLIIALAIVLESGTPVFFKQDRIGKGGKVFKIYKFRSMVINAEKTGMGVYCYKGDPRVTKVGNIMRKTSIDELPQLINILKGEMSFIGPRPTLIYHPWPIDEYTNEQKKRFDVLPGVTGLAQLNGRKELSWDERIVYDVEYVNNVSLGLDVKLFFKTIYNVLLMRDNVNVSNTSKVDANVSNTLTQ